MTLCLFTYFFELNCGLSYSEFIEFVCLLFGHAVQHVGPEFPNWGLNPHPLVEMRNQPLDHRGSLQAHDSKYYLCIIGLNQHRQPAHFSVTPHETGWDLGPFLRVLALAPGQTIP